MIDHLETLYNSKECDIFYNKEHHVIQSLWKGVFASGERLRNILDELISALEQKHASVILADAREMHVIGEKDQEWILNSWYPRAVTAGFRHQGLILSKDTYNELAVKNISRQYDSSIVTTSYFSTYSDALKWITELSLTDS
jgi:hypothetical protein